jgi:hypothetical protein
MKVKKQYDNAFTSMKKGLGNEKDRKLEGMAACTRKRKQMALAREGKADGKKKVNVGSRGANKVQIGTWYFCLAFHIS